MTAEFVRERITKLRLQKGVSEYKMSYDLGHSRSYINNISSGKALPSLYELFAICEYFDINVVDFFDEKIENPELFKKTAEILENLSNDDIELINKIATRLKKK